MRAKVRARREDGASLIGMLLALVVLGALGWMALTRLQPGTGAAAGVPGGANPMDRSRQQQTLSNMQSIGRAIEMMLASEGRAPEELRELANKGLLVDSRMVYDDGWGNRLQYSSSGRRQYRLTSYGADGRPGPRAPDPWAEGHYEVDIVLEGGRFTQAPGR